MPFLGLGVPALAGAGAGGGAIAVGGGAAATGATISTGTLLTGAAVVGTGLLLSGDTPVNSVAAGAIGPQTLSPEEQAERLRKVRDLARGLAAAAAASCATGNCCQRTIVIPHSRAPESARHIDTAQAAGYPSTLTYDANPSAARARRYQSTKNVTRVPGYEPDEYPPAAFVENGGSASVWNIPAGDNRVAGGIIGANLVGVPAGCRVTIITGP